jgi:hypothetical protein
MSRRARRKRGGAKEPWFGKAVVFLGAFLLLALTLGYAGLRAYLHSEGFRKFLSAEVSKTAKVTGTFSPFRWDGLAVETEKFEATGEGMVVSLEADQIGTDVGFGALGKGAWELRQTRVSRVAVGLDFTRKNEPSPMLPEEVAKAVKKKQPGWVPKEVLLESLAVGELAIRAKTREGEVAARGMKVRLEAASGKGAYQAEITGGTIDPAKDWLPEIRVEKIRGAYRGGSAFITSANLKAYSDGRIDGFGEWNSETGTYALEGDIDGVKCDEVLSDNWARRLTGDISSTFSVNNISGKMVMNGELVIRNGTLTALPMLDALAAYADTRRFRILPLSESRTKWRYSEEGFVFTDFVMASEGLIRLEGNFTVKGRAIDGHFRLGLVPGTLTGIPGAETHVFLPGERGLLWAPIRITGTLDDPKEDLTDRLITAAGIRMFEQIPETGEKVLKFTKSVLGENPAGVIEKGIEGGRKVIDEGGKVIEGAEDVIKGLLGD